VYFTVGVGYNGPPGALKPLFVDRLAERKGLNFWVVFEGDQ